MHDGVHHGVQQCDVGVGLELEHRVCVARQLRAARIGVDQLRPVLDRVLDPGRRDRMVRYRVRADQENHPRSGDIVHLVRYRARGNAFHQRGDARGMAQPRAVVHVVRAEAGAHQLLEQVGLLVGALGRAEAGQRMLAIAITDLSQLAGSEIQRFLPARLAEILQRVRGVEVLYELLLL
ncbi:hypothetical protein D3C83_04560 [compost metagenome]